MNKIPPSISSLSPEALSFIPLFYIGWTDSVLSPSEMEFIHKKIQGYKFLTEDDKAYLIKHSDPTQPPDEKEFTKWLQLLKQAGQSLATEKKTGLIDLGIEIARSGIGQNRQQDWKSPDVEKALREMKSALGLDAGSDRIAAEIIEEGEVVDISADLNFDPAALKSILDGPTEAVKDRMRKLLRDPVFAIKYEPVKESYRELTLNRLKELARQGLSGYSFPQKFGGSGRFDSYLAVFEMLGYSDLSLAIKFGVQYGLFGGAVFQLGTEKHHKKYLPSLIKADLLGCFAMTETGHGSNVRNLETTAVYDHDRKVIVVNSPNFDSGKEYIGNAMHAHVAAVFAQLRVNGKEHGVHVVIVPIRDKNGHLLPRVRVEDNGYKMGLNGVDNGRIWLDNIEVPVENLLDKYGSIDENGRYQSSIKNQSKRFFTMLGALVAGRIAVGLVGINASKTALTIALRYAIKRRQFAPRDGKDETLIIDYPTHQKRLFPLLAKTYAYYFALDDLGRKYVSGEEKDPRKIETLAAGLKAKATWHTTRTIQECREACGGKGYLSENRLPSLKADTDIFTTFEGDNTVLMQLVAKGLLTDFKQNFHDDGYIGVLRVLLTKARHEVYAINPFARRNTDVEHLLDEDFHKQAFRYRRKKILLSLSGRMRKYLKRGMDSYHAFLKVQLHTIDLADAYIDEVVLKAIYDRVETCEDEKLKAALQNLARIYALSVIQENKGWFLETDYLDGVKTKAIRRVLHKLFRDIRPDIRGYVDAFAIPEELIGAAIIQSNSEF